MEPADGTNRSRFDLRVCGRHSRASAGSADPWRNGAVRAFPSSAFRWGALTCVHPRERQQSPGGVQVFDVTNEVAWSPVDSGDANSPADSAAVRRLVVSGAAVIRP